MAMPNARVGRGNAKNANEERERHGSDEAARRGGPSQGHDVGRDPLVLQPEALRPQQDCGDEGGAEHDGPAEDAGEHSIHHRPADPPRRGGSPPIGWESAVRMPGWMPRLA
jgi:hypothetical protein